MQDQWEQFLKSRGGEIANGLISHFGKPSREQRMALGGDVLCDLSHYALVTVSGQDAKDFLHRQLINDIKTENTSKLNGYCNTKGRLIADFRVFKHKKTFFLRLSADLVDLLIKRLNTYKLRSQVEITPVSNHYLGIGVFGKGVAQKLADTIELVPDTINQALDTNNSHIIRIPALTTGYEIYGNKEAIQAIWDRLNVNIAPVGYASWALLETLAALPHLTQATSEQFVPQMLNYQAIDGLSFDKGCYPGQEIVARMHYLGKLKKRLYLAKVSSSDTPIIGQDLYSKQQKTVIKAGTVVQVASHPDGYDVILAVIQNSEITCSIRLGDSKGPKITIMDLPYTL